MTLRRFDTPDALLDVVERAYASPGRAYHTLDHVREVLREFDRVDNDLGWEKPREIYLAILFHDAIYVPGAHDNEAKSAELARATISDVDVAYVVKLIEDTARHGRLTPSDVDRDEALFLDCDMAILGADPERFDAYDRQIALEYAAIPPGAYAAGRRAFLQGLLAKPRIFLSEHMHDRLDACARANLARALLGT